ncbi:MAG: hypothetical protein MUP90_00580, partial [Gammaproteobacteria bacterium]|nr:hypothetical protein [Gammaproteobacteria bacterium]
RQIGEELSVRHILEGGVQKAEDRIRINVQLIDAQSDSHLWAETYDRQLTTANIFAIQSEISRNIARALQLALSPETTSSLADVPTDNLDAYGYYTAAMNIINDSNNASLDRATQRAIELLQSAVKLDPGFALAWTRLAEALEWRFLTNDDAGLRKQADDALAQAYATNPNLPDNHLAKSRRYEHDRQFEQALSELALAEKGMPGNAEIYRRRYWIFSELGRGDEAQAAIEQAMQLDPRNEGILRNYGWNLLLLRRYQQARDHFNQAIKAFPTKWLFRLFLAEVSHYQYGDSEPLKDALLRPDAPREAPDFAVQVAEVAWISGDIKTALS